MGRANPHASNPVDPLFNGAHSSRAAPNALDSLRGDTVGRVQTVLTPALILDPVRKLFGGQIGFDPCHAEGSLVRASRGVLVPWDRVWIYARELAHRFNDHIPHTAPAELVYQLLRSEIRAKDVPKEIRAAVSEATREVRDTLRVVFWAQSGHAAAWYPRTFCNPPFGDRGPETILATFREFCAAFARAEHETVFLCPVRTNRTWWLNDVLATSDCVTYLKPIKFHGWDQTFPAPLALAYKAGSTGDIDRAARCFAHLGDTFSSLRVTDSPLAQ